MRKRIGLLFIVCCLVCVLVGCKPEREIKSITINKKTYNSLYVYSFENAEILNKYNVVCATPVESPSAAGFAISKIKVVDYIEVWQEFLFSNSLNNQGANTILSGGVGTKANVVKLQKEFPIFVKENADTYTITYYTYTYSTDIEYNRLIEDAVKENSVEVAKENVVIEYYN